MTEVFTAIIQFMIFVLIGTIGVVIAVCAIPVILIQTWGKPDRPFFSELWRFGKKLTVAMLEAIGSSVL
jgi:hypothetical protein